MMCLLSIISFLLLGGFLLLSFMRFGAPDMISDIYYQLQNCTGSEVIGGKKRRNYGLLFTFIMFFTAVTMMVCMLDTGKGIQCLAFIGCAGLLFVGAAPNYLDADACPVHKGGAIVAAVGCVGWCLSVCWMMTFIVLAEYLLCLYIFDRNKSYYKPWYWAETAGFIDVYFTYWLCV